MAFSGFGPSETSVGTICAKVRGVPDYSSLKDMNPILSQRSRGRYLKASTGQGLLFQPDYGSVLI